MAVPLGPSFTDSFRSANRAVFYEGHKPVAVAMICIVFLLPFVGVYINGLFGAAWGVLISVLCYHLTPYIWLRLSNKALR